MAHTVDKQGWPDGPWMTEPDYLHWVDAPTDLDCLIVRNDLGNLCGYTGVPEGHPWHGVDYNQVPHSWEMAHGGLTYSAHCAGHVCHHVEGRPEPVWWLGFDCAHSSDYTPGMDGWGPDAGSYRNVQYVQTYVRTLCAAADTAKKTS